MVKIKTMTLVQAPVERCFKLSLSVDLRLRLGASTGEVVVEGPRSGLLGAGDAVRVQAQHLGVKTQYQSVVDGWRPYSYFREVMTDGVLVRFEHERHFAPMNDGTRIREEVRFKTPLGWLGRMAERLVLRRYVTQLLRQRNAELKRVAESSEWHRYLDGEREVDRQPYEPTRFVSRASGRRYAEG